MVIANGYQYCNRPFYTRYKIREDRTELLGNVLAELCTAKLPTITHGRGCESAQVKMISVCAEAD